MYTPDGAVLPPGAARADGREAIERFWRGAIDAGVGDITLRPEEVAESGDLAYEVGSATLKPRAGGRRAAGLGQVRRRLATRAGRRVAPPPRHLEPEPAGGGLSRRETIMADDTRPDAPAA